MIYGRQIGHSIKFFQKNHYMIIILPLIVNLDF